MSDIPGKAYHASTNKRGLLASNLTMVFLIIHAGDVDNVPEKEVEQNADFNGGTFQNLERRAVA